MASVNTPTSPLAALGLRNNLPAPTNPQFWNYERLSNCSADQILAALQMVPGMLEAKTMEIDTILPVCVKFCASHHSKVKKAACDALISCSENYARPDVGILAVNILMKDLKDANPEVRSTAVDTICSLSLLAEDHSLAAISTALKDSNPRVRKSAVVGCGKVWRHSPHIIDDNGMVDVLYTMVRDPDPSVMTFSLQTINVILSGEGGVVINSAMTKYLLSRLDDCQDLEKCFILEYLQRYQAKNANARLDLLNHIDPYLNSKNPGVFLATLKLFKKVISEDAEICSKIEGDFIERIAPSLRKLVKDATLKVDLQCALLQFVRDLCSSNNSASSLGQLSKHYKDFKLMPNDRTQVCLIKCEILQKLACCSADAVSEEIFKYLVAALLEHHNHLNFEVKTAILKAVCHIELSYGSNHHASLSDQLLQLMRSSPQQIVPLLVKNAPILPNSLLPELCISAMAYSNLQQDGHQILRLIYQHNLPSSPYILERILKEWKSSQQAEKHLDLLLLSAVKTFIHFPSESQHILASVFHTCRQYPEKMEAGKLVFYAGLLSHNFDTCQKYLK